MQKSQLSILALLTTLPTCVPACLPACQLGKTLFVLQQRSAFFEANVCSHILQIENFDAVADAGQIVLLNVNLEL